MCRKSLSISLVIVFLAVALHTSALLSQVPAPDPSIPPMPPEFEAGGLPPTLIAQTESRAQAAEDSFPKTLTSNFLEATEQRMQAQEKVRAEQTRSFYLNRTSQYRWNSLTAIPTPIPQLQAFRHEDTNIPIRPNNSLPAAHDPNDQLNPTTHGTSSLQTYQLSFGTMGSRRRALAALNASSNPNPFAMSGTANSNPFAPFGQGQSADAQAGSNGTLLDNSPLDLEIGMQVRPGIRYDTGNTGAANGVDNAVFNPGKIALNGSAESHHNGQIYYFPNSSDPNETNGFIFPYRPQAGISATNEIGTGRAYTDLISNNDGSNLKTRTAVLQYVDPSDQWVVIAGQAETVFGDLGSAASPITTGALPVGTVSTSSGSKGNGFIGVQQLRVAHFWHDTFEANDLFEMAVSAEDPRTSSDDTALIIADTTNTNIVQRYPTLVGRVRYQGRNLFDSYQIAALVKPLVTENAQFQDTAACGYGVSANTRFEIGNNGLIDTIYFGAVAGQGIGGYIFGNIPGAVVRAPTAAVSTDSISLLNNFGTYGAYRHVWTVNSDGTWWSSNFMGGIAQSGDPGYVGVGSGANKAELANRLLYQAGCNLLWQTGCNSALGLEYQYGSRLAVPGGLAPSGQTSPHGEDHQIMLVFQFGLQPSIKQGASSSATKNATASRSMTAQDAASAASANRTSRLRF